MKSLIFVIVSLFIITLSATQPFGFSKGMTYEELKSIDPEIINQSDDLYIVKPPKPSPLFDLYAVRVHKIGGLYYVKALSEIDTNIYGMNLKSSYNKIVDGVIDKYGEPEGNIDMLLPGSIWDEPQDYMMSLLKEERYVITEWNSLALKDFGLKKILMNMSAFSKNDGVITLGYYFEGFEKFSEDGKDKTQW